MAGKLDRSGSVTAEAVDDAGLRESLAALSRLVTGDGSLGLANMLRHVADLAVAAIPGADGASLTLLEPAGREPVVVASAEFVSEVDSIQYGLGEGPSITTTAGACTVTSGSSDWDDRWPRFGPLVSRIGVHSALSLSLRGSDGVVGAMNVYAHAPDAFDLRAVELGELFAAPAAIAVQNAQALTQARHLTVHLQAALTNRAVVDHALGIVMSRTGCTPRQGIDKLRAISQSEQQKLSVVARHVLEEAVRRARDR